jgi:hypothetical protein
VRISFEGFGREGCQSPLLSRVRVLTTVLSVLFVIFIVRMWPDVRDIGFGVIGRLKEILSVK